MNILSCWLSLATEMTATLLQEFRRDIYFGKSPPQPVEVLFMTTLLDELLSPGGGRPWRDAWCNPLAATQMNAWLTLSGSLL